MSRLRVIVVVTVLAAAGCSDASTSVTPTGGAPCDLTLQEPTMHPGIGMSYANLTATLVIGPATGAATSCTPLGAGDTRHLSVGDQVAFIANQAPTLTPTGTDAVTETKMPARTAPGPGAPVGNNGYIVTLTGAHPGRVQIQWFNCGGTAC